MDGNNLFQIINILIGQGECTWPDGKKYTG